jgi:Putative zinc-finger
MTANLDWHVDAGTLQAYADDRLDFARAASVETHLTGCRTCRAAIGTGVAAGSPGPATRHADSWDALLDRVDVPRLTVVERALIRCRVPEHTARVLASSELTFRWWLAGVGVLVAATALALLSTAAAGTAAFLLLAPVLPVAGVALAYGAGGEPAYEVAVVAPYSSFRRVLVRSVAALACWLPVAAALSVPLPDAVHPGMWMLPALALTAVTLAVTSFVDAARAAAGVGVVWLAVNVAALRPARRGDLDLLLDSLPQAQAAGQVVLLAALGAALALLVARRARFERITPA